MNPTTIEELQAIVQAHQHKKLTIQGGGTKSALSSGDAPTLSMRGFSGILEYEPNEYTFTAYAGTPIKTIQQALAEHGQYLPFDPILVEQGATLGGTVAANTSGSGRWRYGGVRDFILGVRFVDGQGRYVRSGGKVVKNAAGFDLSKFFVGSLGQFGVLVEMSFKVFPKPEDFMTLYLDYHSLEDALQAIFVLMGSPLEFDTLDLVTTYTHPTLYLRVGGSQPTLSHRIHHLHTFLRQHIVPITTSVNATDEMAWQETNNLEWRKAYSSVVKIPITPRQVVDFEARVQAIPSNRRYTTAGNVAWVALDDPAALTPILKDMGLVGLRLLGNAGTPHIGDTLKGEVMRQRMKQVLDPHQVFRDEG